MNTTTHRGIHTGVYTHSVAILDTPFSALAIRAIFAGMFKDVKIVGSYSKSEVAIDYLNKMKTLPDLLVMDIHLEHGLNIEPLKQIKTMLPRLPIVVFSEQDEKVFALRLFKSGAQGYISKFLDPREIGDQFRRVLAGETVVSRQMNALLLQNLNGCHGNISMAVDPVASLSDRELEVFTSIGQGNGTRFIAKKLGLSLKTVESHRAHIKEKLNLKDASELVHRAINYVSSCR